MRGDIVHRVYGVHQGREKDTFFGAYHTIDEAKAQITKLQLQEMHGRNWAEQYHNNGFVIREAIVQTDFEIPSHPKPRDRYFVRGTQKESNPGGWATTTVEVFRRASIGNKPEKVYEYERNYGLLKTFEPFRQGGNEYALISPDYSATSVVDLATGLVVASEPTSSDAFCPVGFYVPDWWDLHDGLVIPGSEHWKEDCEWPTGQFGFVWGCVWGDDSSWKVQYLDLTAIQSGVIRREERFGYLELATEGYKSPCFELEFLPEQSSKPPPFIKLFRWNGETKVHFNVEMQFDFASGKPAEWQRLRIADFD